MLEVNVKNKEIGGRTYYVRAMPPMMALGLLGDLQSVVTGALGKSAENTEDVTNPNINLGEMIAGIGGNLRGAELMAYADRILNKTYVSVEIVTERGTDVVPLDKNYQEEMFTGHIMNMLELMWFVLEVNYKDFLDSMPNLSGIVASIAQK